MNKPQYVLIYVKHEPYGYQIPLDAVKVLVVEKNRPAWQSGKYNLLGGKIEEGEEPASAALRELKEESGLVPAKYSVPWLLGKLEGDDYEIFCYTITVNEDEPLKPQFGETEAVDWVYWDTLENDPKLIPNLKIVIPLMAMGVNGWTLTQTDKDYTVRFKAE